MSKTKFLGIPAGGKRAGWIEMEGGSSAGVGDMVVTVTINDDGTYSADKTFAEVQAQIKAGNRVVMKTDGGPIGYYITTYLFSENAGIVEFVLTSAAMGTPTLTSFSLYKDNHIVGNMFTLTATQMGS